jgi:arsenite oxidase small subunit
MKLSLEVGSKAHNPVTGQAVVRELEKFCRNSIQC